MCAAFSTHTHKILPGAAHAERSLEHGPNPAAATRRGAHPNPSFEWAGLADCPEVMLMLGRPPRPPQPRESSSGSISRPFLPLNQLGAVQHDHSSNLFPIIVVREHKQIGRADSGAVVVGKWSKRKQKEMSISISPHSRSGTAAAVHPIRLQEEVLSAAR